MTQVLTQSGWVEGQSRDQHVVFRGIPFAKPPVGRLRFRAPEPAEPWPGVHRAHGFGPSAIQRAPTAVMNSVPEPRSEDCLYLNIYTPGADWKRRPVLFWVHGGGFSFGAGSEPLYDGAHLAERGDVVVVTINYRLGALGFLCLPEPDRKRLEITANAGLLDQIAALRWVRDNIAAFGGNPDDVTLMGESAGAYSVGTLLGMPLARGLFHKAVAQSGARFSRIAGDPARGTHALLKALEISHDALEALWDVPAERFVSAQLAVARSSESALNDISAFAPLYDADTVPLPLEEAFARGEGANVPLMLGTTRDEINLFLGSAVKKFDEPLEDSELRQRLQRVVLGADEARIGGLVETYRRSRVEHGLPASNRALLAAITSDGLWRVPNERFMEAYRAHQPATFLYLFTYESPGMRGALRSCHALDLPFMFGTWGGPNQERFAGTGEHVRALSERMMDAWLAFAKTGDPSLPDAFGGRWPAYDDARRPTMVFDATSELQLAPYEAERAAWQGLTPRALIG
jgi:para-nitrobenzyl esterase